MARGVDACGARLSVRAAREVGAPETVASMAEDPQSVVPTRAGDRPSAHTTGARVSNVRSQNL